MACMAIRDGIADLIRRSFSVFHRQFMQIRCGINLAVFSIHIYTMVEMAKAHGLNIEKYLTFLLEKRPHEGMPDADLEKLTPWSDEARAYCGYAQQIACI